MTKILKSKKFSRSKKKYSEDELYYLKTKIKSKKYMGQFTTQIAAWYKNQKSINTSRNYKQYFAKKNFKLNPNLKIFKKIDWEEVVLKRESKRNFNGKAIPFSAVSNLLLLCCGLKKNQKWISTFPKENEWLKRALPSAGAIYPLEFYILALNISGLPKGLYHFNSFLSCLTLINKEKSILDISKICSQHLVFNKPSAIIYTTAIFEKSRIKYGSRALRFILLEAGGINTHLGLLSTAMKLGGCTDGAGYENRIEQMIGIDGRREGLVSTFIIGRN